MLKLLKLLKEFKLPIGIILLFVFLRTLTDLLLPTLMSDIIDTGVVNSDIDYIIQIGLIMLGVALFGGVCSIVSGYYAARVGMGYGEMLRNKLFTKVSNYSLHEIDMTGTASLITRTTNDITQVQNTVILLLRIATMAPMMAIGSIIMALSKDVPLTGVILVVIVIMGIVIGLVASKAIPLFKVMQLKVDKLNLVMRERLTGLRVIRAFDRVKTEEARFEVANKDLTDTAIKVNKLMAILNPFLILMFSLASIALIWFGGYRVDSGAIGVGDMMAFIQYGTQIMFAILMLTMIFVMVPRASASATRILEILDLDGEIVDPINPKTPSVSRGEIEFKDVSFFYHSDKGASEAALENISFTSKPGEYTAIIGGTGSGKSTLMNMIPRFYDVTTGEILVDGVNIKDYAMSDLRNKIGLVPQQAVLFSGTVEENIKFGKKEASDEEMIEAATIARANEFVMEMEDGYQSTIAQGGTNISGGQKQRLSIARAIVRKPEIFLFDDSFSALDYKTEAELRARLREVTKESTVIVVAQKVTSVMNADQIIVLDQGKISGIGTHKELLQNSLVYQEIVASQLSKEEIANG